MGKEDSPACIAVIGSCPCSGSIWNHAAKDDMTFCSNNLEVLQSHHACCEYIMSTHDASTRTGRPFVANAYEPSHKPVSIFTSYERDRKET